MSAHLLSTSRSPAPSTAMWSRLKLSAVCVCVPAHTSTARHAVCWQASAGHAEGHPAHPRQSITTVTHAAAMVKALLQQAELARDTPFCSPPRFNTISTAHLLPIPHLLSMYKSFYSYPHPSSVYTLCHAHTTHTPLPFLERELRLSKGNKLACKPAPLTAAGPVADCKLPRQRSSLSKCVVVLVAVHVHEEGGLGRG